MKFHKQYLVLLVHQYESTSNYQIIKSIYQMQTSYSAMFRFVKIFDVWQNLSELLQRDAAWTKYQRRWRQRIEHRRLDAVLTLAAVDHARNTTAHIIEHVRRLRRRRFA